MKARESWKILERIVLGNLATLGKHFLAIQHQDFRIPQNVCHNVHSYTATRPTLLYIIIAKRDISVLLPFLTPQVAVSMHGSHGKAVEPRTVAPTRCVQTAKGVGGKGSGCESRLG